MVRKLRNVRFSKFALFAEIAEIAIADKHHTGRDSVSHPEKGLHINR